MLKFDCGSLLYLIVFFKISVGFEMKHWINCHKRWNTSHEFLVVFRDQCRYGTERARGGLGEPAMRARVRFIKFLRVRGGNGQKNLTCAGLCSSQSGNDNKQLCRWLRHGFFPHLEFSTGKQIHKITLTIQMKNSNDEESCRRKNVVVQKKDRCRILNETEKLIEWTNTRRNSRK